MYVDMCVTDFSENDVSLCILNFIIFKRFLENKLKQELFFLVWMFLSNFFEEEIVPLLIWMWRFIVWLWSSKVIDASKKLDLGIFNDGLFS